MSKKGKRFRAALGVVPGNDSVSVVDAVHAVKKAATAKFDETIDLAMRLGVDPRHSDQMVRSSVTLPHGTGRKVRVAVFAKGEKEREAREAGAEIVGAEDLAERIRGGFTDFDATVATPDLMKEVGKLGKVLGPRGLMPNPKAGTVTFDVAAAVTALKAGKIEYRVDKAGNIHVPVGKASFSEEHLTENIRALIEDVLRNKPSSSKGRYVRSMTISSTMGPGVHVDLAEAPH